MANIVTVGCVDPRVQHFYEKYMRDRAGVGQFYNIRLAGCCSDPWAVLEQIYKIQAMTSLEQVVLLPHEDCRMYDGADQTEDLRKVRSLVYFMYPRIAVSVFMVHLVGRVEGLSYTLD